MTRSFGIRFCHVLFVGLSLSLCFVPIWVPAWIFAGSAEVFTWYDGDRQVKIYLNPELLAEFGSGDENSRRSAVKGAFPNAKLESKREQRVRIWKLPQSTHPLSALKKVDEPEGKTVSPVFEEGKAGAGRRRALPGNVIVTLNPQWSEEKIENWISRNGLKIVRRMENNPHSLLVETPPGLASLKVANRLYESGDVVSASPNWWKESVMK